jgi:hypothetical protein
VNPPEPTSAQILHRWTKDADAIGIDFNTVWTTWVHTKAMMEAVGDSERARKHPEAFYLRHFVLQATIEHIILGVRRQVDRDKRARSLRNLLEEIIARPDGYALDACVARSLERADGWGFQGHRDQYEAEARALYVQVADASGTQFDVPKLQADLAELASLCADLKTIADKYIAHKDREAPDIGVDFATLDDRIAKLRALQRKYTRLFDGGSAGAGEPDPEEMRSLYRFPWLADADDLR